MIYREHVSLKPYNTFGIDCLADHLYIIDKDDEILRIIDQQHLNPIILGGGSNILFTKPRLKNVIHLATKGISIQDETKETVDVSVKSGESWGGFVDWSVKKGYGGIENLSDIPGSIGAAPIQNIGAYGTELKDVLISCRAISLLSGREQFFSNKDCKFSYRNSIFKSEVKGQFIITEVLFRLRKSEYYTPNTSYGDITEVLNKKNVVKPQISDISQAIKIIRNSKLPSPKQIANAGSFFKNPIINTSKFRALKVRYPEMPYFEINQRHKVKISAAWLIDTLGLKGKNFGNAGIYKKQPLILISNGSASGFEIKQLALEIIKRVQEKFDVILEFEVNVI